MIRAVINKGGQGKLCGSRCEARGLGFHNNEIVISVLNTQLIVS